MLNKASEIKVAASGLWWLWLSVVALVLDQVTKHMIVGSVALGEKIDVLPVFQIAHVHNHGAGFSFLSDAGGWQRWALSLVAVVICGLLLYWMRTTPKSNKLLGMSYSLIIGGAIGNLYDRLVHGFVEDFIHVYYQVYEFPTFNIADIAISLGAMLLIADALYGHKSEKGACDAK